MPLAQTIGEYINSTTQRFRHAGIPTARLDCLVLLEDELRKDRAWVLAHPEFILPSISMEKLNKKIDTRSKHIPIAYIRGKSEFYGRDFEVDNHTLIPRPETETMIDVLKSLNLHAHTHLLDIGTGSGCIAITAALEIKSLKVSACDIDRQCLDIAIRNADRLQASVLFSLTDLLENVGTFNIMTANLPYVPNGFKINIAATHEPRRAIFGGKDGLDLYRRLFHQITLQTKPSFVLTESLPFQHDELSAIAKAAGYNVAGTDGFIQLFELV